MARLAKPARDMQAAYDVVVVGSGYGGGVAAARLARAGLRVCVLERGREFLPGDFPDSMAKSQAEFQVNGELAGRHKSLGKPSALFDLTLGRDVHVLSGCGLGGTSLINANVCLTPNFRVFESEDWPSRLRLDHWLELGFGRARAMLRPEELPASAPAKLAALEFAAEQTGHFARRVPLHIAFEDGTNAAGVEQKACTHCGDCMGGCNVGAKTTVHATYLAEAARYDAEIFTGTAVRYIEKVEGATSEGCRWRVMFKLDGTATAAAAGEGVNGSRPAAPTVVERRSVMARHVVVAAGTLGSNEIMMRSRERGLALAPALGKRFCTNADAIAFGYNNDRLINGIGTGAKKKRKKAQVVGPGVSGMIDLRQGPELSKHLVVVEAAVQSAMAPLMPWLLSLGAVSGEDLGNGPDVPSGRSAEHHGAGGASQGSDAAGRPSPVDVVRRLASTISDELGETGRTLESLALGPYRGAAAYTQTFLAVGHDDRMGEIAFEDDHAKVDWPDAAAQPVFERIEAALKPIIAATKGTYIANPTTSRLLGGNLLTVHPLGGCAMAEDAAGGVVDHKCRVFDGGGVDASTVHEGLYICDGSVIPRPLGVHPLYTITAIAERAMALMLRDLGLAETKGEAVPERLLAAAAAAAGNADTTAGSGDGVGNVPAAPTGSAQQPGVRNDGLRE